ncbi:MAG: FGGY family carbohydrate kinase, partial [Thermoplasmatota archaeon]
MKPYVMAVDDGTTGIRAILFDHDAKVVAQSYEELHQYFPQSGWCEQDPVEIWEKAKKVMKKTVKNAQIDAKQIKAIGIATQRSTNLLWDKQTGKPVYNAITWQDTRTADLCNTLEKTPKMKTVRGIGKATKAMSQVVKGIQHTKTGARLITTSTLSLPAASSLAHTRWIMDEVEKASDLRKQHRLLCGTIDTWLIWNMTNGMVHATDFSNASTSGMFDMYTESWSDFLLDIAMVPSDILPVVKETNGDFGLLHKKILGVEIPLCSAVADQQAALFAEGCFHPGDVKCTNGTGSFIDMNVGNTPPPSLHRLLPLVAWKINGKTTYMLEGMINTTGSAVQWLKDNLHIIKDAEQSDEMASAVNSTEGVYFVPSKEVNKTKIDQTVTKQAINAIKALTSENQFQAIKILLDKNNLLTLSPVFTTIMRSTRSIYNELENYGKDLVDNSLLKLLSDQSYLSKIELNLNYIIQILSVRHSQEKEELFVKLFETGTGH